MEQTYILFCGDVSGSMKEPYNKNYNIKSDLPKSDSLFEILEKSIKILSKKNQNVIISSLLFGCTKSQTTDFLSLIDFIIDNISLIKEYFTEKDKDYRVLLTQLLKSAGAHNISNYMYKEGSPTDIECKLFYKALKNNPKLVGKIVSGLPPQAKDDYFSSGLINVGGKIPIFGNIIQKKERDTIHDQTRRIKRILEEFCNNYEEIGELNKLQEFNWEVNIPKEKTSDEVLKKLKRIYKEFSGNGRNDNIFDLFKDYIYSSTPLCNCLLKDFQYLKTKEYNSKKILIILSDGMSTDGDPLKVYNNQII